MTVDAMRWSISHCAHFFGIVTRKTWENIENFEMLLQRYRGLMITLNAMGWSICYCAHFFDIVTGKTSDNFGTLLHRNRVLLITVDAIG